MAQCPLVSTAPSLPHYSLGEFLGYLDWLWYPGLPPVLVSIAFPFAFHILVFFPFALLHLPLDFIRVSSLRPTYLYPFGRPFTYSREGLSRAFIKYWVRDQQHDISIQMQKCKKSNTSPWADYFRYSSGSFNRVGLLFACVGSGNNYSIGLVGRYSITIGISLRCQTEDSYQRLCMHLNMNFEIC